MRIAHLCALVAAIVVAVASVQAATITVTTTADGVAVDGVCSLREAVRAANLDAAVNECSAGSGADQIVLAAGTYLLSISGTAEDAALTGDLDLTGTVTVTGAGANLTTVNAQSIDRVFQVRIGATVVMSGMTITGGRTAAPQAGGGGEGMDGHGGGVYSGGTLTLNDCAVTGNAAVGSPGQLSPTGLNSYGLGGATVGAGGGLFARSGSQLTVNRCLITGNSVTGGQGGNGAAAGGSGGGGGAAVGGGIFGSAATITVTNSTLSANSAKGGNGGAAGGGGCCTGGGGGGAGQTGGRGGMSSGCTDNGVAGGRWGGGGGGGSCSNGGAGGFGGGGGGGGSSHSPGAGGTWGGGGNNTGGGGGGGGGGAAFGGAIYADSGTLNITASTLTGNTTTVGYLGSGGSGGGPGLNIGGALFVDGGAAVSIGQSILAGNTAMGGVDCQVYNGTVTSLGYNLESSTTCGLALATDHQNANPLLRALADYGGPTSTHALQPTSPAVNAAGTTCQAVDQRGAARPSPCDIGAFELLGCAVPADCDDGNACTTDSCDPMVGCANVATVFDLGDAPAPYPTLFAASGASHLPCGGVYLGACVDAEADGQPNADATGDDASVGAPVFGSCVGGNDEDGVSFPSPPIPGTSATVNVTASAPCTLSAWLDFNGDGDWLDAGEDIFPGGTALVAGVNSLSFPVPPDALTPAVLGRFRCTTAGVLAPTGAATNGEVEDHRVLLTSGLVVNEVDSDSAGVDSRDFVELWDLGRGATSLGNHVLVLYDGATDLATAAFDLDGRVTDSRGFFVIGQTAVEPDLDLGAAVLDNGPDAVALYYYAGAGSDFVGTPVAAPPAGAVLRDAVVYDTGQADDVGLLALTPGQPQVDESGAGDPQTNSIQRCPDGFAGGGDTTGFVAHGPTPNLTNYQCLACASLKELPMAQWQMVSLPCDEGAGATVASVFGDDITGAYYSEWVVWERDEVANTYTRLDPTSLVVQGPSYWIYTILSAQAYDNLGGFPLTSQPWAQALVADPAGRMNMVGSPYLFDVDAADLNVDIGGPVLPWGDPGLAAYLDSTLWRWSGAAYEPFNGGAIPGNLQTASGLWLRVYQPCTLLIPPVPATDIGGGPLGIGSTGREPTPWTGWMVRLIVESDGLTDRGNLLGQRPDSADGLDANDLEEIAPFGDRYLTLLFRNPQWPPVRTWGRTVDLHALRPLSVRDSWKLVVLSSEESAKVTLRWEGPAAILKRSTILTESGETVRPTVGGSFELELRGGEATLTWLLND